MPSGSKPKSFQWPTWPTRLSGHIPTPPAPLQPRRPLSSPDLPGLLPPQGVCTGCSLVISRPHVASIRLISHLLQVLAHTPTSQLGLPRPPIYIKALPAPPCPGLGFLHPQHQSLSNTQSGLLICSANPLSGTAHEGRDFCFLFADTTSAPSRVPNATFPDHLNPKVPSFGRDISSFNPVGSHSPFLWQQHHPFSFGATSSG